MKKGPRYRSPLAQLSNSNLLFARVHNARPAPHTYCAAIHSMAACRSRVPV